MLDDGFLMSCVWQNTLFQQVLLLGTGPSLRPVFSHQLQTLLNAFVRPLLPMQSLQFLRDQLPIGFVGEGVDVPIVVLNAGEIKGGISVHTLLDGSAQIV